MADKRLIDANSAKLAASDYKIFRCQLGGLMDVAEFIDDQPTVDALEVVRCRDCIHYFSGACLKIYSDGSVSQYAWQERNEDDFCSYGERKDGDD